MKIRSLAWIGGLAGLVLLSATAMADSHARIVRLSYTQGDVQIDRGQGAGFERAITNLPIVEGAQISTGDGAQAELEFEDGSTVRLAPNTRLAFSVLALRDTGARVTGMDVSEGVAYVDVAHLQRGDEITFNLPNRSFTLEHSVRFRLEVENDQARVAVYKGELDIAGKERSVAVKKNETITLELGDFNRYWLANAIQPLPSDQWDNDRQAFRTQYSTASANRDWYPYNYGYNDLSYYGSTFYAPGYGYLWRPFGVSYGWDPYGQGAWCYYPSAGFVFVSNYAWGWAPYRYGRWMWVNGYGWGWAPGTNWRVWNTGPSVGHMPQGYTTPRAPGLTPAGGGAPSPRTVWVGGGPGRHIYTDDDVKQHGSPGNPAIIVGGDRATHGATSTPAMSTGVSTFSPMNSTPVSTLPAGASRMIYSNEGMSRGAARGMNRGNQDGGRGAWAGRSGSASQQSGPSPRYDSGRSAPSPHMDSPRMSAPSAGPGPAPTVHMGGGGAAGAGGSTHTSGGRGH